MMSECGQQSIDAGDSTVISQSERDNLPIRLCFVGVLQKDESCLKAADNFTYPVLLSDNGKEYISDENNATYFVLADFELPEFEELQKTNERILGKPAFLEMASEKDILYKGRPVYCLSMRNSNIVFTGFRKKSDLSGPMKLIHYMGGSVKNTISYNVTHLVAYSSGGEKYNYAITFNIPVMGTDWVNACWAYRDEMEVKAQSDCFNQYKLPIFTNLRIVLIGFSEEDQKQMEDLIVKNGGFVAKLDDTVVTHVVVDDQNVTERPQNIPNKITLVKAEWFWSSIQIDACANESLYSFEPVANGMVTPKTQVFSPGTPGSKSRRKKRLRETVQQLADNASPTVPQSVPPARNFFPSKRRSSVSDLAFLSGGDGSFAEDSLSNSASNALDVSSTSNIDIRHMSARQRIFNELVETECNYVDILNVINHIIKEPLENPSQPGGPMLDSQELRYIFGHLPPICEVHSKLRNRLLQIKHTWTDDTSVGKIILEFTNDLDKVYPPFVNYYEEVKELLERITAERPRFHAFLKIAQSKPGCNRQSFKELLIRPVQRLPSMMLLIQAILSHTDKSSPDYSAVEEALDKIKDVMAFINDDKRRTEAKVKLFEIHNNIEQCPPNLVASHRTYISKVDVMELTDTCSGRGDNLTIFLFSDIVEICKRKGRYNSIKSPSTAKLQSLSDSKKYKHLDMISLAHIKRVINIRDTEDCRNAFALIVRIDQELNEKLYTFVIQPDSEPLKASFIKSLSFNMANVVCRSDVENFIVKMDPQHLDIDTSDLSFTVHLSKALKFATRTGRKVGRAFSFNKSPGKLKRAVSSVMSPFGAGLQQSMRGATSVNNLSDLSLPTTPSCSNNGDGCMKAPITTPTPRRRLTLKRL